MVTIEEIRRIGQDTKPPDEVAVESWYSLYVLRKISPYFSKLFVRIGVSANQVTSLSIICGLIGSFLLTFGDYSLMLISCIFYQFWNLFDAVDGEVARVTDTKTISGKYLESINEILMECSFVISIGIGLMVILQEDWYLVYGLLFALANSLLRYAAQVREQIYLLRFGKNIKSRKKSRKTLIGRLYGRFRSYFTCTGIYWVLALLVLVALILPYDLNFFILEMSFNQLSLYFFVLGIVWSTRCIISMVTNYRVLHTLDLKLFNNK